MHTGSNFSTSLPTFIYFFDGSYLMDVKGFLIVVLICIYITISDVAHLFMCLLAIWIAFLKKCLFKSFAHFWIGLFVFCCLVLGVLYRLLILIPYQIYDLQVFSPLMSCIFTLSVFFGGATKLLHLKEWYKRLSRKKMFLNKLKNLYEIDE